MLKITGREHLPIQAEYPEAGGVVLYENIANKLYLDSDWNVNLETTTQVAVVYFNDKAESWTSPSIYLNDDIHLLDFIAYTIKPNGEIIKLTEKDLHPTKLREDYKTITNEKSVRFTFPGVEPGSVLFYSYRTNFSGWFIGDYWFLQEDLPKIYSRYSVEIPKIFFRYGNNWTYYSNNFPIDKPQVQKNLLTEKSQKDASKIYFWEMRDIPALINEPASPPYLDIAHYVSIDLRYDNWNELSKIYWKMLKPYMADEENPEVIALSNRICQGAETETEKIEKIFNYAQHQYRYLAYDIGKSGYIPNKFSTIVKNKYGDCKDMTVLIINLLRAQGIKAFPALTATKSKMLKKWNLISLKNFNHMLACVKTSSGKEYWLDATGSNCPLGEIYPSLEGQYALIILENGKSSIEKIPASRCTDNTIKRYVTLQLEPDGRLSGHAKLIYKGNPNLSLRSRFKNASANEMQKIMTRYLNANTQDIELSNLKFDDPSQITGEFNIEFDFKKENFGSNISSLFVFNPTIFQLNADLDRFINEERKYPIIFNAPITIADEVRLTFDPRKMEIQGLFNTISKQFSFISFLCSVRNSDEGKILFRREYSLKRPVLLPAEYQYLRELEKSIALANAQNIVLKKK